MDLVTLPTEEEASVFLKFSADNGIHFENMFIGGTYIGNGFNNWYWINTGLPVKYQIKFDAGEPNNTGGRENCLSLTKKPNNVFLYNDINCYGIVLKFACEHISK